jgi:hypothetical protein
VLGADGGSNGIEGRIGRCIGWCSEMFKLRRCEAHIIRRMVMKTHNVIKQDTSEAGFLAVPINVELEGETVILDEKMCR